MTLFSKLCALSVFAGAAVPFGCSSSDVSSTKNALDGSAGAQGTGAASGTGAKTASLTCGSTPCAPRAGIGIEKITQCCTDSNECGFQFPGASKCLPPDQVGSPSGACGSYTPPDVMNLRLDGCCGPQGCGKLDAFLGCIVNTDLGLPAQSCTYDPTSDCEPPPEGVPCDGPEDCPTGKHCCSSIANQGPSQTGCYDSCVALDTANGNASWRELCHEGDTCENSTYQCLTSSFLPSWLTRCFNTGQAPAANLDKAAGSVNCGANVCSNGQKCCYAVSPSTGPSIYCADANAECKCHLPDAGAP